MKKKILLGSIVAIAIIAAASWSLGSSKSEALSDVLSANVEALAKENPLCPNGCLAKDGFCICYGPFNYAEAN
jgi:hypothetical protein